MCKERNPHAYCFKGSMEDTLFEDGSFDVVYNFGGINETDIDKSLAETVPSNCCLPPPDSAIHSPPPTSLTSGVSPSLTH